jgi:hypothetical protein
MISSRSSTVELDPYMVTVTGSTPVESTLVRSSEVECLPDTQEVEISKFSAPTYCILNIFPIFAGWETIILEKI